MYRTHYYAGRRSGYWDNTLNQREFLEEIAKDLGIEKVLSDLPIRRLSKRFY